MLTAQQFQAHMQHALGRTPDPAHDLLKTLNLAGRSLTMAHEWAWRKVTRVPLVTVNAQDYVALPADFDELIQLTAPNRQVCLVSPAELAYFKEYRAAVNNAGDLICTVLTDTPAPSAITLPTPRLWMLDTMTTSGAALATITYRRGWVDMVNASDVPAIENRFERALLCLARAEAMLYEKQEDSIERGAYEKELERLISSETMRQAQPIAISGGANDMLVEGQDTDLRRPPPVFIVP